MQSKQAKEGLWILVLGPGEEVREEILAFAKKHNIRGASFVALGAFERAVIGYFDWHRKKYQPIPLNEQVEVISLTGDLVRDERGAPSFHAHAVLGQADGYARGGHLLEGHVRPTLEVTLTETPAAMVRRQRPELGLALIDME